MTFATDRIWPRTPGWMNDPEYAREIERLEWEIAAQQMEDAEHHRENVRLGFEEPAA